MPSGSNDSARPGHASRFSRMAASPSNPGEANTLSGGNVTTIMRVSPGPGTMLARPVVGSPPSCGNRGTGGVAHTTRWTNPGMCRNTCVRGGAAISATTDWPLPSLPVTMRRSAAGTPSRLPDSDAKVHLLDAWVVQQGLGRAGRDDAPLLDHVSVLCELQRLVDVLFHEHHGDAPLMDLLDDAEHVVHH